MVRHAVSCAAALACAALAFAAVGSAKAATAKRLSVDDLTVGTAVVKDRRVQAARTLAARTQSSWWGGTYRTKAGEAVRVNVSDFYAYDPGYPQSVVDFLGALTHGSELSRLTLWVAPLDLIEAICGKGAIGCYDPSTGYLQVIGSDAGGYTVEEVLMHEYGHHVATNRSNAPWQAGLSGPKRWSSYENVCSKAAAGVAFPGDEGTHYRQNPGEAFAESYMFMNAQRLGAVVPPWEFDPMFMPDYTALSKIFEDVTTPWTRARTLAWNGAFARRGATRSTTLSTPLDGTVSFRVAAPRGTLLRIYSGGRFLGSVRSSVSGTICGQRSLTMRLVGGGKGRFHVLTQVP